MKKELSKLITLIRICYKNRILESKFIFTRKSTLVYLDFLWSEGFLLSYSVKKNTIHLFLNLDYQTENSLSDITLYTSTPCYLTWPEILEIFVHDFRVILIVKTNKGIFSNSKLRELKLGGELIMRIN